MTKRELVLNTLKGEVADIVPTSFSLHFPPEKKYGQASVEAHLDFFKKTDTDIIKIMNENLYPSCPSLFCASDLSRVKAFGRDAGFIQAETDLVKAVLDKADPSAFSVCTIQGACASFVHIFRPQYQALSDIRALHKKFYKENKNAVLDAIKRISETQCLMVESVLDAGCDGIYYAALGGEASLFSREEFEEVQAPFNKQIMEIAKKRGKTVILHMCKSDLDIGRFSSYAPYCDVVNWGVYENSISLDEGAQVFPDKVLMGGLANRTGLLVDGSAEDIRRQVHSIRRNMAGKRFILGADCTLATNQDISKVKAAVDAARDKI